MGTLDYAWHVRDPQTLRHTTHEISDLTRYSLRDTQIRHITLQGGEDAEDAISLLVIFCK